MTREPSEKEPSEMLTTLPLDRVTRNPDQPRKDFDPKALDELAASIRELGLLQPILVRPHEDGYQVVAGERRWRAAQLAGLTEIPAIVVEADDAQSFVLAVTENVARRDMTVIEEAAAYAQIESTGKTKDEIAAMFGKTPQYVAFRTQLLDLDPTLQDLVAKGQISVWLGWHLARLSTEGQYEVVRRLGEFKNDEEAKRFAIAVYNREHEATMFDMEPEERVARRREVKGDWAKIEKLSQVLAMFSEKSPQELAALMDGELGLWEDRAKMLVRQARQVQETIGQAVAAAKAGKEAA